ncbi:MAG: SDR family NAD(P)-dependent oxidoreductase, partial [Burkholderiales bacterium]|nr:SDR family NAD(P)-dependent oxidoreductase [Burkholderiales bacterium]
MTDAGQGIAIFGATSAIAQATARIFAAAGARLFLTGRQGERLAAIAADLRVRGASEVHVRIADFSAIDGWAALCASAKDALGTMDVALVAHGSLPDQEACERDEQALHDALEVNLSSHVQLLMALARILEEQERGCLVSIGSVAGDRGKRRNYVYGAAKAGVAAFAQGLMGRFARTPVHVLLVKPGFVDTPMTAGFAKGLLWIRPDQAAAAIVRAIRRRRSTVYVPWFWRWIMAALKILPDR